MKVLNFFFHYVSLFVFFFLSLSNYNPELNFDDKAFTFATPLV